MYNPSHVDVFCLCVSPPLETSCSEGPFYLCSGVLVSLFGSTSYLFIFTCPCLCHSFHDSPRVVSSALLSLAVSATILAPHDVRLSPSFCAGCHAGALHIILGHTACARASILWLWVRYGQHGIVVTFSACFCCFLSCGVVLLVLRFRPASHKPRPYKSAFLTMPLLRLPLAAMGFCVLCVEF